MLSCVVFLRMIILWPAFPCWVTQSPSPQSPKTFTRTTSSNCISSPTSTISDRRVNTLLRGTDAHVLSIFAVMLSPGCQRIDKKSLSLPAGGWRSSAVPQSPPAAVVSWTTKSPILTELAHLVSTHRLPLVASAIPPPPPGLSAFLFYTYLGHLYMCPCTFGAFLML